MMAARWSGRGGGGGSLRTAASQGAMTPKKNLWPGQEVAAVVAAAAAVAVTTVGLLPRPSLSSHLRRRSDAGPRDELGLTLRLLMGELGRGWPTVSK